MKKTGLYKLTALLLALLLFVGCTMAPSLTEGPYTGYLPENSTAYKLYGGLQLWFAGAGLRSTYSDMNVRYSPILTKMTEELDTAGEYPFLRFAVPAGAEDEDLFVGVDAAVLGVDIEAFPVVKVSYRTNSKETLLKTTLETWARTLKAPADADGTVTGDGSWQEAVVDLRALLTEEETALYTEKDQVLKVLFRPFGQEKVTAEALYFDVAYIGFFPDKTTADEFKAADEAHYFKEYAGADFVYEEATEELIDGYMDAFERRRDAILHSPNTVDPAALEKDAIYVSSINGNDENWGLSPEDAVQSIERLAELQVYYRDMINTVLFERGSMWRSSIPVKAAHTYSSYGEGEKPRFYMSIDGTGANNWVETEAPHVWRYRETVQSDIGNIIFNEGECWGVKLTVDTRAGMTDELSFVTNGRDVYHSEERPYTGPESITHNLEYYHDPYTKELFLRCEEGNPGTVFTTMEMSQTVSQVSLDREIAFVTLDNLAFMYSSSCAVATFGGIGITVQNCVFEWIGGGRQGESEMTRYGNGFQNWGSCTDIVIKDCYMNQIYDSAITTQYSGDKVSQVDGFTVTGNAIEYMNTAFEFFNQGNDENYYKGVVVTENYSRYAGFHFGHQRPAKNANVFDSARGCKYYDSVYENNVSVYCSHYPYLVGSMAEDQIIMQNNVDIASADRSRISRSYGNITKGTGDLYLFPFRERYIRFFVNAGIHQGSKFYYYTGDLFPEEAEGVYYGYSLKMQRN